MKVVFADSFWKSLKKLSMYETWWYKTYEVFRYKIPMFFENIWFFRKELWKFRSWDYTFNLMLLSRSLEKTVNTLEFYGNEIEIPRMKKVEKIKRVILLINSLREDDYIDRAEKELGELKNLRGWLTNTEDTLEEKEHNRKVFDLATKIEKDEWNELFVILKGQDLEDFNFYHKLKTEKEKKEKDWFNEWFDGSGMKHWWD